MLDILCTKYYNIIVPKGTEKRKEERPMGKKKKRKSRWEAVKAISALISSIAALIAAIVALLKE